MKIAFVCGKGGVGKSTLCFLVGLGLEQAGKRVAVEDRDPQRSIAGWIQPDRDRIQVLQENAEWGGDFHLVDTRPAIDDASVTRTIGEADFIIIPCSPSPAAISAMAATATVVTSLKRPEAKALILLNQINPRTILGRTARAGLEDLGIPVMKTQLPDLESIRWAITDGWDALEEKTQATVFQLALEVLAQ